MKRNLIIPSIVLIKSLLLSACQSGGSGGTIVGNENGSDPVNENEAAEYRKAIVRCYKTGGTRVIKIMGTLRCY